MDMPGNKQDAPTTINDQANALPYPKPLYDALVPDSIKGIIYGGADYIQRNAYCLEYLIDYCNQAMSLNGSNEQLVIVGPSLGGQISRYALRDIERRGLNHNCRLWVSFDSPHEGAYVPLGLQYSINELAHQGGNEMANLIRDAWINSPAAQQLTLHLYKPFSETVAGVSNYFYPYYNEINADPNFGFPRATGLRKIAMLSGSDLGVALPSATACQMATEFKAVFRPRGWWAVVLYTIGLSFGILGHELSPIQTQQTYLAPATNDCIIFRFKSDLAPDYTRKIYAPLWSNTSLDLIQGGFVPAFKWYKERIEGQRPKKWYKNLVVANVSDFIDNGTEEPTYSTLAIGLGSLPANPARKWDENFRRDKFNQPCDVTCPETKESPFDMYWAPDINTRHDSLLLGHVSRLRKEIIDKQLWPRTQLQRQATITGNKSLLCAGETATYSVTNPLPNMVYNWTPSSSFLQVISGQGTSSVTIQHTGTSSITGDYTLHCSASSACYNINIPDKTLYIGKQPLQG